MKVTLFLPKADTNHFQSKANTHHFQYNHQIIPYQSNSRHLYKLYINTTRNILLVSNSNVWASVHTETSITLKKSKKHGSKVLVYEINSLESNT